MSANNDSIQKTLLVAILLCLVCSVIVAGAAVSLKPIQQANKQLDKNYNILLAAGLVEEGAKPSADQIEQLFADKVTAKVVNLSEGRYATAAELDEIKASGLIPQGKGLAAYNQRKASKDPAFSSKLPGDEDIASIKRQAKFAAVYTVENNGVVEKMVLPVHGYGLWSTLYGFLALEGDLETVVGLGFYSHAETPGLGGEVDNPSWKALWKGKELYNSKGELAIKVVKGKAAADDENSVDGLSGATLTSKGVSNLVQFWVGENGFGKFLATAKGGA
ncbi:Na(+)-translocating NADH-quinone reductase subunit C [Bacterioplanoides pacificum]|uniref:Na(+)-translocating NADH-quinone reductase subunit C n=1 Tax=Bacterioplanoides pacificum TaxID=1171596 RepID=A0ABV7VUE0_9GAMM